MAATMSSMREHITFGMNLTRNLSLPHPAERLGLVRWEHKDVYEAINTHDVDGARTAMRRHIENAGRRVFDGHLGAEAETPGTVRRQAIRRNRLNRAGCLRAELWSPVA